MPVLSTRTLWNLGPTGTDKRSKEAPEDGSLSPRGAILVWDCEVKKESPLKRERSVAALSVSDSSAATRLPGEAVV